MECSFREKTDGTGCRPACLQRAMVCFRDCRQEWQARHSVMWASTSRSSASSISRSMYSESLLNSSRQCRWSWDLQVMAEVSFQPIPQEQPRAVQPHLDIGRRQIEDLRSLLGAEFFDITQDHDDPVFFRKRPYGLVEGFEQLLVEELLERHARPLRHLFERLGFFGAGQFLE